MTKSSYTFFDPEKLDASLPARLRELAIDVQHIIDRARPPSELMEAAPLLVHWRYVPTLLGVRLVGKVGGHPKLRGGQIMTSPLWVVDPHLRWARTTNRYYRLGARAEDGDDDMNTEDCKGILR